MLTRTLIKCLTFLERDRPNIELHADARLSPEYNRIELKRNSTTNEYPTDPDIYIRSRLTNPKAVRQWLGFQTNQFNWVDEDENPLTSVMFRLSDGSDDYWWDGGTWAVAAAGEWSSEGDVATNILTFISTVGSRELQVVVNLRSTDEDLTPHLSVVKLLYSVQLDDFKEDLVIRSLIPELRTKLKPVARTVVAFTTTSSTIDVGDFSLETPYKIVDIDAVFNHTQDPDHLTDLVSSYDSNTKIITLSAAVPAGEIAWVRFIYEPLVATTTSQDYSENDRVPSVILADLGLQDATELPIDDHVGNKATGVAIVVPAPRQGDLQISIQVNADKATDMYRLNAEVERFFDNNKILVSTALDERYRLWLMDEFSETTEPSQKELHSSESTIRIIGVRIWNRDAYEAYLVTNAPAISVKVNPN